MSEFNLMNNNKYNNSKYSLLLCEIWHPLIHGYIEGESDPEINGHYLLSTKLSPKVILNKNKNDNNIDSDYDSDYESDDDSSDDNEFDDDLLCVSSYKDMKELIRNYTLSTRYFLKQLKESNENINIEHPILRNYLNIINIQTPFMKPQIGEIIFLKGDEAVCIIKTHWIKIIQRKWKKIFEKRKQILKNRLCINSILYWQMNGKWDENCKLLPTLNGMLSDLN